MSFFLRDLMSHYVKNGTQQTDLKYICCVPFIGLFGVGSSAWSNGQKSWKPLILRCFFAVRSTATAAVNCLIIPHLSLSCNSFPLILRHFCGQIFFIFLYLRLSFFIRLLAYLAYFLAYFLAYALYTTISTFAISSCLVFGRTCA